MTEHEPSTARIYRLKLTIVGAVLVIIGLLCNMLSGWLGSNGVNHLLVSAVNSLGDAVIFTGALGILLDFVTGREREAKDLAIQREVQEQMIPNYVDAVLHAIDVSPDALRRVATPDLLDSIATNAMSLRLGDDQFAREIYADVRDQAIRAAERWEDVEIDIRLSTAVERNTAGVPLFDVLVQWEYTTVPSHAVRRFACTSDRSEYDELVGDVPATSTWFMTRRPGLDASSRDSFELLSFTVDGEECSIRRQARKTGQTYVASIGQDVVDAGQPVRIRQTYRVVTSQSGHYLFFEIPQPSHNPSLTFDYTNAREIERLTMMDLVSSSQRSQISRLPEQAGARVISADLPGWLLPRAGFTFVWTLLSEQTSESDEAKHAA